MNMRTGKLVEADFDDVGLVLAIRRQQALDDQPKRLAWKCNQGRGAAEHVSQMPRAWTPNAVLCFWACYAVGLVSVMAFIAWAAK